MQKTKKETSKKEPTTMAELLAAYQPKLATVSVGQKIKAKVIAKTKKALILDIGGKSEGLVTEKAFVEARDFIKTLKVGDTVTVTVLVAEGREGSALLSLRQASHDASWDELEKAKNDETAIAVVGRGTNAAGITVDVNGQLGFIPSSQLGRESAKDPSALIGKYFKAKLIEVDRGSNKIVLSEKEVTEAGNMKLTRDALSKIKDGEVYDGVVTTVAAFGCFVKLTLAKDVTVEGLVHISELAWNKVGATSDVVSEGDTVKVKVLGKRDGKLSLSMRAALADPWIKLEGKYEVDTKVKGKVTRMTDFGAFVEVEPGIEGLIHLTQIPPGKKLTEGEMVDCYVQEINIKEKKMGLRLALTEKPLGYK